ncbi:hypothetical protein MKQ70_06255 [Chitinophaga sedimenti]|uniref:hypothetical protein n=1 Tax=Chitinophaga sedimenti TaxID=2033606 RepID=UPI0020062AC1|nr:hypothetical protein [Chitinophaga sedimenti]MCK7554625.1 hypothetical protein [Chitinophaga sedimenti]
MKKVPIRHIVEPALRGNFSIQQIEALLGEKDMIQPLHRHSFFFILVLKKGTGEHQIDFTPYPVSDTSVFLCGRDKYTNSPCDQAAPATCSNSVPISTLLPILLPARYFEA